MLTAQQAAAFSADDDDHVFMILGEVRCAALNSHWSIEVPYMHEETAETLRLLGYKVVQHDPESRRTVSWHW